MTLPTRNSRLSLLIIGSALALSTAFLAARSARPANPDDVAALWKNHNCVGCDLSDADLSGANLPKADLSGANLTGAKLYKADLREAVLTGAGLASCDLSGADLTGAKDVNLAGTKTDAGTKCPDGSAGPCK